MNNCIRCGEHNAAMSRYCRRCGHRFGDLQPQTAEQYDYSPPSPYVWKTDELQTKNETRRPRQFASQTQEMHRPQYVAAQQYQPAHLMHQPLCPRCGSGDRPRIERRISTGGWITFAVLMVTIFPLFWIGLLIKEDVAVCQTCKLRLH